MVGWTAWSSFAQQGSVGDGASASSGATGLITHVHDVEGRPLTVVVVEPVRQVLGVYHVSRDTGEIKLKSIRSLQADLQMQEFNSPDLAPGNIQKRLQNGN
ncbi:MAG: hypothetical protein AAGA92_07460 [Planctomycetota bacterium]